MKKNLLLSLLPAGLLLSAVCLTAANVSAAAPSVLDISAPLPNLFLLEQIAEAQNRDAAAPDAVPVSSEPMTRAALASFLWEQAGCPVSAESLPFSDVSPADDCAPAIRWAIAEHLLTGYEDGSFAPERAVTREECAVVLYRMAQNEGGGFRGMWAFLPSLEDRTALSPWAYEAACWLSLSDILVDTREEGRYFRPHDSLTAAEAADAYQAVRAELNTEA